MRLIDADILERSLTEIDEHINMDIFTNEVRELIDNAPTVEAIPVTEKAFEMFETDYKNRLKSDMVAMLEELDGDIERLQLMCDKDDLNNMYQYTAFGMARDKIIEKINALGCMENNV